MSQTVFTPEALAKSKNLTKTTIGEYRKMKDVDTVHFFIFPSNNVINEANGDGDLIEVEDFGRGFTKMFLSNGAEMDCDDSTVVYVERYSAMPIEPTVVAPTCDSLGIDTARNARWLESWIRENRKDIIPQLETILTNNGMILLTSMAFEAGREFQRANPDTPPGP